MSNLEALKERLKHKPEVRPNEGVRVILAPLASEEQIEKIESAIVDLETAVKDTDQAAITTKISELMSASLPIFEAKSKAAEPKSADETKSADDGVVDAEFTEKK